MLVKKLAVPLINDKILALAEHCFIATTAISEQAFDFVKSRMSPKCKIDIVTGLDGVTSPEVLKRIWRHYQDRITLKIYTKNFFHANVYIFNMPYLKTIAFIGTGHFTLGGLKDNEEIFYKITDAKEIEVLKSWYTGYYEFSEPLTENMIEEYEWIYPSIRQREIASREEKEQVMELTTRGFNWGTIRFKNQYFKKEDYLAFGSAKASLNTAEIQEERSGVWNKLTHLSRLIKEHLEDLGLYEHADINQHTARLNPADYPDQKFRSMQISYGRSKSELARYSGSARPGDFMSLQLIIRQRSIGIWLVIGKPKGSKEDREFFRKQMEEVQYRATFFKILRDLGRGYWIEVAGEKKAVEIFQSEDALWEFTRSDDWRYYAMVIGRNYTPGDPEIGTEAIVGTIEKESDKLILLYRHIKEVRSN
jgi:hypothetical protein